MEDEQRRDEWVFKTCTDLPACVCRRDGCRLVAGEQVARLLCLRSRIQRRQGPYVYSLYREQYGFPERAVAILFVTGFTSGGLTAPLVGVWADQHGRRRLCMAFCVAYTLACVCTLFPSLITLLAGRMLGGLSTSILFSCFESWLMSSSSSLGLKESELSSIMGRATLVNGFVATAAGVVSNELVAWTHNFQMPFVASGGLLLLAWTMIKGSWGENFGSSGGDADLFQIVRLRVAWRIVRAGPSVMSFHQTEAYPCSIYRYLPLDPCSYTNMLRRVDVPLRFPLGAFITGGLARSF